VVLQNKMVSLALGRLVATSVSYGWSIESSVLT